MFRIEKNILIMKIVNLSFSALLVSPKPLWNPSTDAIFSEITEQHGKKSKKLVCSRKNLKIKVTQVDHKDTVGAQKPNSEN